MENSINRLLAKIVKYIDDKFGQDIVVLDLEGISTLCDYFVITSASSTPQIKAIADEITDGLEDHGIYLSHKEGYGGARWVLLDYGDIVVHVFHTKEREFYNLEGIWKDAQRIDVDKLLKINV